MELFVLLAILASLAIFIIYKRTRSRQRNQAEVIRLMRFPPGVRDAVQKKYPHLDRKQLIQVEDNLREYFHLCRVAGNTMVSMPSQAVDEAWHAFILFTRQYEEFCQQAFGRFLHHTPAEAMSNPKKTHKGIQTAWRIACRRQGINPKDADSMPDLFALDNKLEISDGFHYQLNRNSKAAAAAAGAAAGGAIIYYATDIGCGSENYFDIETYGNEGCSSDSGDSGCSSGCGGGCGGD